MYQMRVTARVTSRVLPGFISHFHTGSNSLAAAGTAMLPLRL
jgi:hypothetical protein